jgi:acetyltransferase-like isoleucine patch superfamily enzyme
VFRYLRTVDLSAGAHIGQFNWISGGSVGVPNASSRLVVGAHAAITSRHYIDASGGVLIGPFATIAGERSVILSHQIDYRVSKRALAEVTIGTYALVSSSVKVVPGSHIPAFSLVAMGSVVTPGLTEQRALYAGVPATLRRHDIDGKYFHRKQGPAEPGLAGE